MIRQFRVIAFNMEGNQTRLREASERRHRGDASDANTTHTKTDTEKPISKNKPATTTRSRICLSTRKTEPIVNIYVRPEQAAPAKNVVRDAAIA